MQPESPPPPNRAASCAASCSAPPRRPNRPTPVWPASTGIWGAASAAAFISCWAIEAAGKTAFLESLAWEAVGNRRPALYYAFKSGSLEVWERLIVTLGAIIDGDGIVPSALRGADLVPAEKEALHRLDAELQSSVLPYLSLMDRVPGPAGRPERLRRPPSLAQPGSGRAAWAPPAGAHGRPRGVDGHHWVALSPARALPAGCRPRGAFTTRRPHRGSERLLSCVTWTNCLCGASWRSRRPRRRRQRRVELEVLKNTSTGWTGIVPLLLDPSSGLFAEAATAC